MNPDNMHVITNFQIELYHATFLVKSQYFIDILDGFKLFEVSLHHLQVSLLIQVPLRDLLT